MKKTIKSFAKRLKITKNGKILSRAVGQNHFNARERTRVSMKKHRLNALTLNNDVKSRFLINLK